MKDLGNGFDGTISKALETSKLASGKPKWLQDYRVTNLESRIGKYPISVNVSGYVEPNDIELV